MKQSSLRVMIITAIILSTIGACTPAAALPEVDPFAGWLHGQVRIMDAVDTEAPGLDMIAVYSRDTSQTLDIRVDFLDQVDTLQNDIYLAIDSDPGGASTLPINGTAQIDWDVLLCITQSRAPYAVDTSFQKIAKLVPRVFRDPFLDAAVIRINNATAALPERFKLQVWVTAAGSSDIVDQTEVFSSTDDGSAAAPLVLEFWNTLPSATPAQALRRWDGAHTGPAGQRHGLKQLLTAVDQSGIPVLLLDLSMTTRISALELLGGLDMVRSLAVQESIGLAQTALSPLTAQHELEANVLSAQNAAIPLADLIFAPLPLDELPDKSSAFADLADRTHIYSILGHRIIPTASPVYSVDLSVRQTASSAGLTLEAREQLVSAALSTDPTDLVILGGSLPNSLWGDFSVASSTFRYISSHPWIQTLSAGDLETWPAVSAEKEILTCADLLCSPALDAAISPFSSTGVEIPMSLPDLRNNALQAVQGISSAAVSSSAWEMLTSLTVPASDARVQGLQANLLGHIGVLAAFDRWAISPQPIADCAQDLDWDGLGECVLASDTIFTVTDLDGGRVILAGALVKGQPVQWIGPDYQLASALGDPSQIDPRRGYYADLHQVPGALALPSIDPAQTCQASFSDGLLTLTCSPGETQKEIALTDRGIRFSIRSGNSIQTAIPFLLAPEHRLVPGEMHLYFLNSSSDGQAFSWAWGISNRLSIQITGGPGVMNSAMDTAAWLREPEDPNRDNPASHYLPFPMAVLQVTSPGDLTITIEQE